MHAWLGLKLSLFALVVLLSGTLAVVANEIDWLADPAMRASPQKGEAASWGTIAANAKAALPGGRIDLIERGPDPWFATVVVMKAPDGHRRRVLVDPATGQVNRVAGFGGAQRFLRDFHRRLMLPVAIGIPLVTSLSFVLLTSLISGLVTYKKFWRGFFRWPRAGGLRQTTGDLHRLAGIWSLWFVVLVVATSLWYLVELLGGAAPVLLPFDKASAPKAALAQPVGPELDALAQAARAAYPGLEIQRVQYPFKGVAAIGFQGRAGTPLTTDKANAVWVDTRSGAVTMKVVGDELTAHQRLSEMADPLHFGVFGGLTTKLIWFVFGLGLTTLSVSGVVIYASRLAGRSGPLAGAVLRGVGLWALPVIGLVVAALWLTPQVLAG